MKKLLLTSFFSLPLLVSAQSFDPIRSQFGISVGPLGRFDGNGAGLSNVVASGSGGWTGNPNQFSVGNGYTNLKSDLLLTNLNLYYSVTDPLKIYYFGDAGAANISFIHAGTNQFYLMGVDTVGVGMANYDQSKYAVLEEAGNFVLGGGGSFSGPGSSLTALNASALSSGTVATARLGSGTANSSTFLRGDNTWASVASSTNQFWVAASPPNEKYTNLFGDIMEISGAYRVLTVGTNVGNNVQISDGISSFPNGMWIDAGAQEYFVGKISVGTERGQFQLGSGAVSNLTATGVIYAPSNNISGGISAGSISTTTLNANAATVTNGVTFATNSFPPGYIIDVNNSFVAVATNNIIVLGVLSNWSNIKFNQQFCVFTNTESTTHSNIVRVPAWGQNMNADGNDLYYTNVGTLLIFSQHGFGTNFYWKGR